MFSEPATIPSIDRTKFRLVGGDQPLILVPVSVNGRGPFEFILDTGAGISILAPALAELLDVKERGSKQGQSAGGMVDIRLATVESLAIGRIQQEQVDVGILDLSHIARTIGGKIDGDIGYTFFKDFRLTINYRDLELSLVRPLRTPEFAEALAEASFRLAGSAKPLILLEVKVNGQGPFQFALDTGTSTSAISASLARRLNLMSNPIPPVTTGGAQIKVAAAEVESLAVDRAVVRNRSVVVGDFLEMLSKAAGAQLDGIIGYDFLRHYKVVIDYPSQVFALVAS
jgi:predicted aspartyl protease